MQRLCNKPMLSALLCCNAIRSYQLTSTANSLIMLGDDLGDVPSSAFAFASLLPSECYANCQARGEGQAKPPNTGANPRRKPNRGHTPKLGVPWQTRGNLSGAMYHRHGLTLSLEISQPRVARPDPFLLFYFMLMV